MLLMDHVPPVMPASLRGQLTTRVPIEADVAAVAALVTEQNRRHTPDFTVDEDGLRSRMVGLKSWARRQVVVVPLTEDGTPSLDHSPLAWIALEDRATGRVGVELAL